MFQLIVGLVILALVVVYIWLKRSQHSEANLPAVSEDVNLSTEFLDPLQSSPGVGDVPLREKHGQETTPSMTQSDDSQPPQQ